MLAGGCLWTGLDRIATLAGSPSPRQAPDPFAGGEFLGVLPFSHESRAPLETLLGAGLDARLYTNLSSLSPDAAQQPIAIPTEHFYIRTGVSPLLKPGELTAIRLSEHGANASQSLSVTSLQKLARSMGLHLLECAGNTREASFGLISVAEWTGVPLPDVLDHLGLKSGAFVLVSGFDQYDSPSTTSLPGASWIFSREQIRASGAFLAIGMNGRALPPDHGAPVRLVVPGWYGCSCIKWVNEIRLVSEVAQPTSQMREFAQRTHQQGSPTLARDYQPATIDAAAMPVRIEKWRVAGKVKYRVIGILWGGSVSVQRLEIRFNPEENYVPVDLLHRVNNDSWTFWTHTWTPTKPGGYLIRLCVAQPIIRTRRLDMGFYVRQVEIPET